MKVDMSQSTDFSPVPEGMYSCRVEKAKPRVSEAGNQMLNVTFNVEEGDYTGRKIFYNAMLEGKGAFTGQNLLNACNLDPSDFEPEDLIDKELLVSVKVGIRQDNGEPQNEVTKLSKIVKKAKK